MATEFTVETDRRLQVLDVTDRVERALPAGAEGLCTVFVRHTTCGLVVNEVEPRLLGDFGTFLRETVPDEGWAHDELDGNADSHLRALLLGASERLPVRDGSLDLGRWQSVLLVECDGPCSRAVTVHA
jgi:secondary thiamine-phosphate synthase enzyme